MATPPLGSSSPKFGKIIVSSGHMIDKLGREKPRFPASKEHAVREQMAAQLTAWGVGKDALAICGGACGSDIIFAEECQRLGVQVRLLLALPRAQFMEESVAFAGYDWVQRFDQLVSTVHEFAEQDSERDQPPDGLDAFSRCNLWMLDSARAALGPDSHLYSILVWDERSTGDGPGGAADFAARVAKLGGERKVINPTQIP